MTHDEYVKRRDEIVRTFKFDMDWIQSTVDEKMANQSEANKYKERKIAEAQQAIDELVLSVIGEDESGERVGLDMKYQFDYFAESRNQFRDERRSIVKGSE